jgi:hypothetical protein
MEDIYIQNKGITTTFIHNKGQNSMNEMDWNANYDGKTANIHMEMNNNGKTNNYDFQLDNKNLEEMLSIPSINETLDRRLRNDFIQKKKREEPLFIIIEDEDPLYKLKLIQKPKPKSKPRYKKYKKHSFKKYTHISSPMFEEEFLVSNPVSLNKKKLKKNASNTQRKIYKVSKKYSRRTI